MNRRPSLAATEENVTLSIVPCEERNGQEADGMVEAFYLNEKRELVSEPGYGDVDYENMLV